MGPSSGAVGVGPPMEALNMLVSGRRVLAPSTLHCPGRRRTLRSGPPVSGWELSPGVGPLPLVHPDPQTDREVGTKPPDYFSHGGGSPAAPRLACMLWGQGPGWARGPSPLAPAAEAASPGRPTLWLRGRPGRDSISQANIPTGHPDTPRFADYTVQGRTRLRKGVCRLSRGHLPLHTHNLRQRGSVSVQNRRLGQNLPAALRVGVEPSSPAGCGGRRRPVSPALLICTHVRGFWNKELPASGLRKGREAWR